MRVPAAFRLLGNNSGAAAAEMALLLPLLTVIMFAGIEGGYLMWQEHKVVKGVRDGARYAGRQGFAAVNCGSGTIATDAAIKNVTRTGFPDGDNPAISPSTDDPVIVGWDSTKVTVTVACSAATNTGIYKDVTGGAPLVTVSARVPYIPLFGSLGFATSNLTLNANAQAAVMGL